MKSSLRDLPSVEAVLKSREAQDWIARYGRPLALEAVRSALEKAREDFQKHNQVPDQFELNKIIEFNLKTWTAPTLEPVINASGVILHTNLGRAPLSQSSIQAALSVSSGYSNLEFNLQTGKRGSRLVHAEAILQRLTGVESALVVNNNAAAVLLVLTALAKRRPVVIARSQLVEIGGGFRIPDVMKQSGAHLLEVGTTNRVHLTDYETALQGSPALIMRAHRSNFKIVGFTSEPGVDEIAALAHSANIPLVDDLGSGSLLETARYGLGHEPMVQESLAAGADLVCFSGDKLLGGPQAGIIIGRKDLVEKLKKHPLARALRADKLCLAALSATLLHYLKNEAEHEVPVWRMISASLEEIHQRARDWTLRLNAGEVILGESTIGGGSLPGETLQTYLLALTVRNPNRMLAEMRLGHPPVIARLENERIVLDPRTVLPEQENAMFSNLGKLFT